VAMVFGKKSTARVREKVETGSVAEEQLRAKDGLCSLTKAASRAAAQLAASQPHGECKCSLGFSGPACGMRTCKNDCNGNGVCLVDHAENTGGNSSGYCHCYDGWWGSECSIAGCLRGENQGGVTSWSDHGKGSLAMYLNSLEFPFPGTPCGGHGTCAAAGPPQTSMGKTPKDYLCNCEEGWEGPACDVRTCDSICDSQRGSCLDGFCICRPGYSSVDGRNDCAFMGCPEDCHKADGLGFCDNNKGVCVCKKGYSGVDCGTEDGGKTPLGLCAPCCLDACLEECGDPLDHSGVNGTFSTHMMPALTKKELGCFNKCQGTCLDNCAIRRDLRCPRDQHVKENYRMYSNLLAETNNLTTKTHRV